MRVREIYAILVILASEQIYLIFNYAFCLSFICSCICMLRSISSHGSSLFSSKQCVSITHFLAVVFVVERLYLLTASWYLLHNSCKQNSHV